MNVPATVYPLPNAYALEDYWFEQQEIKAALFDAALETEINALTHDAFSFAAVLAYLDQTYSVQDNPLNHLLFEIYLGGMRNVTALRKLLIQATHDVAKHNIKLEMLK